MTNGYHEYETSIRLKINEGLLLITDTHIKINYL